LVRVPHMRD